MMGIINILNILYILTNSASILDSSASILDSSASVLDSSANILDSSDSSLNLGAAPKQTPQQGLLRTKLAPKPGSRISKPGSKILPIQGRKSFDPGFDPGFEGSTLDSTLDSMVRPWIRPGKPGSKHCSTLVLGGSTLVSTLDSTLDLVSTLDFRLRDPGLELQIQGRGY